ncbi:uncharacterized protein LOC132750759 [Ruditapes philippinarum]|uniref:uncharacterized protein LOC132750759 n=1 Tax=Ruditapes philippinarum TaxID=129788 RepID=UPI00295BD3BE|nr:uncharacterized protein LOC132750759 [Ruditapes philippinarum]
MYKMCSCCVTSVLVVVVGVVVSLLLRVDWYTKCIEYMQCQMTCLERDVDTLRADIWDWKFLRHQICSHLTDAKNCGQPYSITVDSVDKKCTLSLQLNKIYNTVKDFEIVYGESEKFKNATKEYLFIEMDIRVDYQYISKKFLKNKYLNFNFEHRHTRFSYYDLLDCNSESHHFYTKVNIYSKSLLQEKYLLSFLTLCFIEMNYNNKTSVEDMYWIVNVTDLTGVVSVGTDIFVQENVILTKGSKIYAWLSTLALVWFFFVILYLVQKMLIALHGFSETFTNCRLNGEDGRTLELTRPDMISVDSGDLNIFTSYSFSVLFRSDSFNKALIFTTLFVVWFFSILAYFDVKPEFNFVSKSILLCVLVICSVSFLILFPFAVIFIINFALIIIAPELMIHGFVHHWLMTISAYLLKICRDCYTTYDKFLKDVISHVRDKYNCVENKKGFKADSDCIALFYNHLDKDDVSDCKHLRLSQGKLENVFKFSRILLLELRCYHNSANGCLPHIKGMQVSLGNT